MFVDIQYGKTQAEKIFIQQLDNIGVEYDEPVDAKETGIEIGELIKGKSMYLYVMDGNNLRYSNISIAKVNKIPYRYILLEENITWTNKLSQEEMPFLCRYYDNRDRNKLFASLTSHGCVKQDINIKTNQSNMNTQSNHDIYISYKTSCYDISKKIASSLKKRGNSVFIAPESIAPGNSYNSQISHAIKNCKTFILLISKDSFDNTSTWQNKEIDIALRTKSMCDDFRILPIVVDANVDEIDYEKWPMLLRSIQCMTLNSDKFDEGIIQITNVLNQVNASSHKPCEIFLAYPRNDRNTAIKVSSVLEKNGFSVWQDLDGINTCDEFAHVIMQAIDEAKVFLLIESKWSRNSEWVKREVEYAVSKKKHIVKILTDNPEGLSGVRRMSFSPNLLEVGTKLFEEKLLAVVLSKGCNSDTSVISKEGERLYKEVNGGFINPIGAAQKKDLENKSFSLFLRAVELGDENAQMYIDSKPWSINLTECVNKYKELYSNFIDDLREGIYNKGVIIAEDETLTDSSQRGRGMERAAFRFMKRAINLGFEGEQPEDYDWYYLEDSDFEGCYKELGLSSTSEIKNEPDETKEAGNGTVIIDDNSTSILHKENQTEEEESYNVFISCKSEDYDFAQPIHDFLIANGLKVFFADAELKEKAESQYADVIDEALDATKHLIVVATSIGHIKSKWVKYEWSTFSNDLKSNYRDGNLITILSPDITPRMLPASLRHMQSFSIENFENILPYVKK